MKELSIPQVGHLQRIFVIAFEGDVFGVIVDFLAPVDHVDLTDDGEGQRALRAIRDAYGEVAVATPIPARPATRNPKP